MQMKKVILVFKTHFDIGFTQLSRDILEYYKGEMLDRVADTCNGTRDMGDLRYVWTMPSWPLATMRDGVDGERAAMLDDLIARGQVTWHALPYTSHYDFSGVEDAVWGLRYAKELSERYHVPLKNAAKMTDVPGYGRFLPELLADAGIRFLHLGCNDFAMPPKVPEIFWWEAPSGKRVLTMYNSGYGTAALPPANWPFSTWMALMNTNDNSGPQTAGIVQAMYDRIHAQHPEAEIVCGTLEDMWDALKDEDLTALPVVRADLADTWIHGAGSYPREVSTVRRLRGRLSRAGRALAERDDPAARADVAAAYDALSLFAEHTWGLDVKTWLGAIPDYDDFELQTTLMLDTLTSDAPSLTKQQQQQLYDAVTADYSDMPRKAERMAKLRNDRHYNALQIKYGYAVTCHKAQGGQWAHVYLDQGYITGETITEDYINWLYTAFTRATEKLFLVNWHEKQIEKSTHSVS